jgi:hypothetical protein
VPVQIVIEVEVEVPVQIVFEVEVEDKIEQHQQQC